VTNERPLFSAPTHADRVVCVSLSGRRTGALGIHGREADSFLRRALNRRVAARPGQIEISIFESGGGYADLHG
jgi:hypothetical protein